MHRVTFFSDSSLLHRTFSRDNAFQGVCRMLSFVMIVPEISYPVSFFLLLIQKRLDPHNFDVICSKAGTGWCSLFDSFYSSPFNLNKIYSLPLPFPTIIKLFNHSV